MGFFFLQSVKDYLACMLFVVVNDERKIILYFFVIIKRRRYYALPVVRMGPSWPSIEHDHSGITAHLVTTTFNVCETLNLGVQCKSRTTREEKTVCLRGCRTCNETQASSPQPLFPEMPSAWQGYSLYHFLSLWYNSAEDRTHSLPYPKRALYQYANDGFVMIQKPSIRNRSLENVKKIKPYLFIQTNYAIHYKNRNRKIKIYIR